MFLIFASISILINQFSSSKVNSYQTEIIQQLTSAIDIQVKVTDIRLAMNEHLLRYLVSINPEINKTAEHLSQQVNYTFTKEDVLRDYFMSDDELTFYFLEVAALNMARPFWENQTAEAMLLTFRIRHKELPSWVLIENISNICTLIFLVAGLICYREVFKKSRNREKSI